MENAWQETDTFGSVNFEDFRIVRGPEGLYTFRMVVMDFEKIYSDTFSIYIKSNVADIEIMNQIDPLNEFVTPGEPLPIQPIVRVIDFDGKPIEGKQAVAFSYVEPKFGEERGEAALVNNRKYFTLENPVSLESDENGYIYFENLRILGSMGESAYIIISVDGIAKAWTTVYNPYTSVLDLPPRGLVPLIISPRIDEIVIVEDFPLNAQEGEHFETPLKVQVLNGGSPVSGVACYTDLYSRDGVEFPLGYKRTLNENQIKQLVYP